jgi:nitroreductase
MGKFVRVEPSYIAKDGCRLVWEGVDEDDSDVVVLGKEEFDSLTEILASNSTGKVELEDEFSTIMVNTDVIQFRLKDSKNLEADNTEMTNAILDYRKVPHVPQQIMIFPKEFLPSVQIRKDEGNEQLRAVLESKGTDKFSPYDLFRIMSTRRSTRNFDPSRLVEQWQIDKILAAADTAPTAGNFQGFEVFYVKNKEIKKRLVEAANNQPFVNAPVVMVFCMNPSRVKMNFPPQILAKFSLQDATLAAAYSQLAASALGLSSIWIGMMDEQKVAQILGTQLVPSSILCIGYPKKSKAPKSRRKLKDLVRVI